MSLHLLVLTYPVISLQVSRGERMDYFREIKAVDFKVMVCLSQPLDTVYFLRCGDR